MSTTEPSSQPLQFDHAEYVEPTRQVGPTCSSCHRPLDDEYYALEGRTFCPLCKALIEVHFAGGSTFLDFVKGSLLGLAAAAVGSFVYYWTIQLTGINFGPVAIFAGWLVGMAVRRGSGNRGGLGFQLLAILLTYLSIAGMFIPEVMHMIEARAKAPGPIDWTRQVPVVAVLAVIFPTLVSIKNPLFGLIYGFALYQAFVIPRRLRPQFSGPHCLGFDPEFEARAALSSKPPGRPVDD